MNKLQLTKCKPSVSTVHIVDCET